MEGPVQEAAVKGIRNLAFVLLCGSCVGAGGGAAQRESELAEFMRMRAEENRPITFVGEVRDTEGNPFFLLRGDCLYAGEAREEGHEKRRAAILSMNHDIQLYGVVVDQHGNGVKDAEVLLSWERYSIPFPGPMKERWIRTGDGGKWEFAVNAHRVSVHRTPRDGDGLIASRSLLFEAPGTGYQREAILEGMYDQDFPRYLYLKTRVPAVYSRLDLHHSTRPDSFAIHYELCSNPYGTRSLETNAGLEPLWQLRQRLAEQARTEVAAGRLLDKTVLPGLIKEAQMKRENK